MKTAVGEGERWDVDRIVPRGSSVFASAPKAFPIYAKTYCLTLPLVAAGFLIASCFGAEQEPGRARGSAEALLEYKETPYAVANWGINFTLETKPYSKEPPVEGRKVARGLMGFGGGGREDIACLWDYRKGKLYLDINNNRDFSDDLEGVFTTKVSNFSYYSQTFTNVNLRLGVPGGTIPVRLDLHLYNPEAPRIFGTAQCRSMWDGKISLQGRDWHVARVDNGGESMGKLNKGYLVLRPWEKRDEAFNLQDGWLDGFGFPERLFFAGAAYNVECSWVQGRGVPAYKIAFLETTTELGELNLTGRFLHRVVMSPSLGSRKEEFTVVLDSPEGKVRVPAGHYPEVSVTLAAGEKKAYRLGGRNSGISVTTNGTAALSAGGPLTNSVSPGRRGADLSIAYHLVGADGATYMVLPQDRSAPPRFVISKDGKQLHSGAFEFG